MIERVYTDAVILFLCFFCGNAYTHGMNASASFVRVGLGDVDPRTRGLFLKKKNSYSGYNSERN